ncbi:opacity associated protein [Mesocricetibacter intestinalis]|uniref:Opacity associated protein n=1 Tax=Mesocricetibacter intestinalis TaxID=1521930 RepID=A0A4V3DA03_9PAST|nr:opacity-associated protein OapA [Mesocricetibacter intestinalis]TDQ59593.1 opacity associated protein [Mesocricetibacter intestinalis]
MEKTPENNPASTPSPAQNELDLGINPEPITPKKTVKAEASLLDKAKNMFSKRNNIDPNQFAVRKEPTFGEEQPAIAAEQNASESLPNNDFDTGVEKAAKQDSGTEQSAPAFMADRVPEPVSATEEQPVAAAKPNMKNPENWAIMQKLPRKHRRLVIALAVAVIALLVLLWLKPDTHTVEDFQAQNNNSLPIEFQPLDQSQSLENAENTAAQDAAQPLNGTATSVSEANAPAPTAAGTGADNSANNSVNTTAALSESNKEAAPPVAAAAQNDQENQKLRHEKVQSSKAAEKPHSTTAPAAVRSESVKTPIKTAENNKATADRNSRKSQGAPVVEAKPSKAKQNAAPVVEAASASAKTLTIPPATSLMQVFRDNNLNIADVNAMTKAEGAKGVLSSFKAGDKVQVSVNSQGRVNTLRLSNGATFKRQADGSYKYQK